MSAEASASMTDSVLLAATDRRWFELAAQRWRELLVDHAN